MTSLTRTKPDGGAWNTTVDQGGGGLPSWWDIVNTPGSESVAFKGAVTISPSDGATYPLGAGALIVGPADGSAPAVEIDSAVDGQVPFIVYAGSLLSEVFQVGPTGAVSSRPSDPAVDPLTVTMPADSFAEAAGFGGLVLQVIGQPSPSVVADIWGGLVLRGQDGTNGNIAIFDAAGALAHKLGTGIGFFGKNPQATQAAHIADPSGGGTQDAEARAAVVSLLNLVESYGLMAV